MEFFVQQADGLPPEPDRDSQRLVALTELFGEFGSDHQANLQLLVQAAGGMLGGDAAVYSRLSAGKLWRGCRWKVPDEVEIEDRAPGRICYERVMGEGEERSRLIRELDVTSFAESDPLIRHGGYRTYLGQPVMRRGEIVGSLAVLYRADATPDEMDLRLLALLARALEREEDRSESRRHVMAGAAKLEAHFRSSLDGILIHDFAGRIIEANPAAERLFGFQRGWLLRMKLTGLLSPDTAKAAKAAFRELKRSGYCRVEVDFRRADGRMFAAEVVASRFEIDGVPHVQEVIRDISIRRQRQAEVMKREVRFRLVFEQSLDGILLHDREGRIVEANGTACRLLGYEREELVGRNVTTVYAEASRAAGAEALVTVHALGETRHEALMLRSDGGTFPAEIAASRVEFEGEVVVQEILRDITARREAEIEVRRAKDEAERANETKSLFLATMSHEIRTPLNGIIGFARLLEEGPLSESQREHLSMVQRSGDILLGLINDILDFSRIESGNLEFENGVFDPGRLLSETAALHHPAAREKDLELTVTVAPEVPRHVRGDQARLRQVLMNLIGNAVKFTATGHVAMRLEVEAGSRLRFTIEDSGPGFTEEQRARLFEPFYQTDLSSTRKHGGTGLGLAICRRLVGAMGGEVEARSLSVGAEFTFWIPMLVAEPEKPRRVAAGRPRRALPDEGCRVLVAEDQPINARLIRLMLERLGIVVELVSDGPSVLEYLRAVATLPGAVLLDMRMPGMDGIEVARRIRAGEAGATAALLPLIAVTGNALESDRIACLEAGMNHHLPKPVTPDGLERVLVDVGLLDECGA